MLIATLPTLTSGRALELSERILAHPLIGAVRYNTGGASPYKPAEILAKLNPLALKYGKKLYVDLEGRQVRIAKWTPFESGAVTLNTKFEIKLPGKIYFRGLGWFEILNANPREKKIYFDTADAPSRYFLGESQSVHIVAESFETASYLSPQDFYYIDAAIRLDMKSFMLSFVESKNDLDEFFRIYGGHKYRPDPSNAEIVLKIESVKGVEFIKDLLYALNDGCTLMAARDDLFLAYVDRRSEFLEAVEAIITKDPDAILASKIMSGLESGYEVSAGDMADMVLMSLIDYENFMFSDELTSKFDLAMESWANVVLPMLRNQKDGINGQI